MILRLVQSFIEQHHLLKFTAQPVIVGISGGADSVALLDVLVRLGYKCIAAHCNFHLRGEESVRDENFVEDFVNRYKLPYIKIDFETEKYASDHHLSIEMAARELRYAWFEKLRTGYDAQAIAIAHHQDDSVETLMLNLIRGTGIRGMTGIRPENGYIVRPFLPLTRDDILTYLHERAIPYVTDSTNLSDIYTRNFIRLKVLPLLEEINPSVKKAIARTAGHLSDAEEIFLYVVERAKNEIMADGGISINKLISYPAPKTILYELLRPYGFSRLQIDSIFLSLDKLSGKTFFSGSHRLIKDRDYLIIQPNKKDEKFVFSIDERDGRIDYPVKLSFEKIFVYPDFNLLKDRYTAYFDFEKLTFPLVLRHWEEGDWFIPFGMSGRKKLSDYFSDHKFSLIQKEACWLLCSGSNIIWIVGERADNRFRISVTTKNVYVIKFFL